MDPTLVKALGGYFAEQMQSNAAWMDNVSVRVWTGSAMAADDVYSDAADSLSGGGYTTGSHDPQVMVADVSWPSDPSMQFDAVRTDVRRCRITVSAVAVGRPMTALQSLFTMAMVTPGNGVRQWADVRVGSGSQYTSVALTAISVDEVAQLLTIDATAKWAPNFSHPS